MAFLPLLRRFWPAIPVAFFVVALLLTRSTNARHRAELAACNQKQEINVASIMSLTKAVDEQNAKVAAMSAAGAAKQKAAADALRAATERERASQVTADALRRSAGLRRAENAPCTVSDALAGARGL